MMALEDKILYLAVGAFIGFVLGYIVRALQDIREKVTHVEETVAPENQKPPKWRLDDSGFMRHPYVADIMVIFTVGLTVWAAFQTAHVNNQLKTTLDCITNYNTREGAALSGRDNAIKAGVTSEIKLWSEYGALYALAKKDPTQIPAAQEKLNEAISAHRTDLIKAQAARDSYPYPNPNIVENCQEIS